MTILSKNSPHKYNNKIYGITSNLINIKVEADHLLIKDDILLEIKKLREKVDQLDHQKSPSQSK